MQLVAGIDVSKTSLEVAVDGGPVRRFANTAAGCRAVGRWLPGQGVTVAVCEPTGGYERPLVDRLQAVNLPVVRAHPPRVRAFARACGAEAKTDLVDAQVLARYGATLAPAPLPPADPARRDLQDVLRRRHHLVAERVQEEHRLDHALAPGATQSLRRHRTWLEREIARLETAYPAILARSPALARQAQLYRSVRGIGALTAAILTAELPELGQVSAKALTALAGLAPWARDSGRQQGYRAIRGGRGVVRRALYLAALTAIRHPGELQRFHARLCRRGKPGKVALVAVMRKLLLQVHAVARRGTPWTEEPTPIA